MAKRALPVILMAVVIIGVAAVWYVRRSPSEPDRYYNREKDFSVRFPQAWDKLEGSMGSAVLALAPAGSQTGGFRPCVNVVVVEVPGTATADQAAEQGMAGFRSMVSDFREQERRRVTLANAEAERIVASYTMQQVRMTGMQFYVVGGRQGYIVSCAAAPDEFPRYRQVFEWIGQSFRLE